MRGERFSIRPGTPDDRVSLLALARRAPHLHTHFDWCQIEQVLADPASISALGWQADDLRAAMVVAAPLAGVSWLRLAAFDSVTDAGSTLQLLWDVLWADLAAAGVERVCVLAQATWMLSALLAAGFYPVEQIIHLERQSMDRLPVEIDAGGTMRITQVKAGQIDAVRQIDRAVFSAPWQLSNAELQAALQSSSHFSLASVAAVPAGYAAAIVHPSGGHLSRLAVSPEFQRQGVGAGLLAHVIDHFRASGVSGPVSVNTQLSNLASQRLYARFGFAATEFSLPVLESRL